MEKNRIKQIYDLTLQDLEAFPIWEFFSEDDELAEDECTVRGTLKPYEMIESTSVVKANFFFANGSVHKGFIDPAYYSCNTSANIFLPKGKIDFWFGLFEPDPAEIERMYNIIRLESRDVFPIIWEAAVPISGCFYIQGRKGPQIPQSGTIEGFGFIDKNDKILYFK